MKQFARFVFLLIVGLLPGALSAATNQFVPVAGSRPMEIREALQRVLPAFDNEPDKTMFKTVENGREWVFYAVSKDSRYVGAAFETSIQGYSGTIRLMLGILPDDSVQGLEVLAQAETGPGAKIAAPSFTDQFKGKNIRQYRWKVRKYGGDVDAVTGATLSSRAVAAAARAGVAVYLKYKDKIQAAGR